MVYRSTFAVLVALIALGCSDPNPALKSSQNPTKSRSQNVQRINDELWSQVKVGAIPPYPGLAQKAGCQGVVELDIEVNSNGKIIRAIAMNSRQYGIGPLCSTACNFAESIIFPPNKSVENTTQHYMLYVAFKLPDLIGVGIGPNNVQFEKSSIAPIRFPK